VRFNKNADHDGIMKVSSTGQFNTIADALDFLKLHMDKPVTLVLGSGVFNITNTLQIDLPYPLTIQGTTFGSVILAAGAGLTGKPMFRCLSECYFKMLQFDATTLSNYGTSPNEDAIRLIGSGTYHEIKDCTFDRFYNSILDSSDSELWLFECDISNAQENGLLIHGTVPGVKVRVSETDFISCKNGVNLSKGSSAVIQLLSGVFSCDASGNAIIYNPSEFTYTSMIISNNSWNNNGNGITGFDFSRPDGRDANCYIENNAGWPNNKPHCKINVINNSLTVTCTVANNWYKANWSTNSSITTNIKIENNKITYLPSTRRDIIIIISGNVLVSNPNRVITIGIVKNGDRSVRYGETSLRVTTANQPFQFSTVIYLEDAGENDFFEMYCSSTNSGDVLTFQDINWFVTSE
jgi:hypothetical protein